MYDTGLADRIRAKGVRVVEIAGWRTRGSSTFNPHGAIHHHTAGSSRGSAPSLSTNIYGRPGIPGPLAQVMQSREPDGHDIAYVIAAGRSNHGGVGSYRGRSGNRYYHGLEVEHTGKDSVLVGRHEVSCRILAAMLEAPGASRDASWVCEHSEYANPPGRKIDFFNLNPPFPNRADGIRARVGHWIGRTEGDLGDEDMPLNDADKSWFYKAITEVMRKEDVSGADTQTEVIAAIASAKADIIAAIEGTKAS